MDGRKHGIVSRDGLRDQGLPLYAHLLGRICEREAADHAYFRRGPGDFPGRRRQAGTGALPENEEARGRIGQQPGTFYTNQFHNADAIRAYMRIGTELAKQAGTGLAAFCGGVGTAGMITGVSRALKEAGCKARIVALEPATSPVLTTGKGGPHRVEGIAAGFRPPHLKDGEFDEVRTVEEPAAREMARRLAREEGIFAGTSSGLNVTAALQLAQELGRGSIVATVAVDTGFKYLAGDLYQT